VRSTRAGEPGAGREADDHHRGAVFDVAGGERVHAQATTADYLGQRGERTRTVGGAHVGDVARFGGHDASVVSEAADVGDDAREAAFLVGGQRIEDDPRPAFGAQDDRDAGHRVHRTPGQA
jgi:hypothetical protein